MLVKKKNPNWQPSEKPDLAVGETLEVTDAKALVISGDAIAIDPKTGIELSAFELYGEIVDNELEEFRQYQAMKKQEALAAQLKKENEELIKEVAKKSAEKEVEKETATEEATKGESKTATEADEKNQTPNDDIDTMSWKELTALGREKNIYKVGMTKEALIKALKNE